MTNRCGGSFVHSQATAVSVLTRLLFVGEVRHGERGVDRREDPEDRVEVRDPEDGRDALARVDQVEPAALRLELLQAADEDADRGRVEMLEARTARARPRRSARWRPSRSAPAGRASRRRARGCPSIRRIVCAPRSSSCSFIAASRPRPRPALRARGRCPGRSTSLPERTSPSNRSDRAEPRREPHARSRASRPARGGRSAEKPSRPARNPRPGRARDRRPRSSSAACAIASAKRIGLPHSSPIATRALAETRARHPARSRSRRRGGSATTSTNRKG